MNIASKMIELKKIILSEVSQTQKHKCHMFSLMGGTWLQIFRCEYRSWNKNRNQENKKGPLLRAGSKSEGNIRVQVI